MEDEFVHSTRDGHSLFAVFDGHAGGRASLFCKDSVEDLVYRELADRQKGEKAENDEGKRVKGLALDTAISKLDFQFCELARASKLADGTTAIVALTDGEQLVVANVGDSRAVLISGQEAIPLSDDHKPDRDDERKRITDLGGRVLTIGCPRVEGNLAVSRAIGDISLKRYVIGKAEIKNADVQRGDRLVLASDGLWDVFTNDEVALHIQETNSSSDAARLLLREAFKRGSSDNITVVVATFDR
eukprot:CAMPEP_0113868458 /NCGR_PEP_ID=MMETSP0780_2-20120614/999_1 /TAXON_ID=652834 /ORGANISM="Palpitomonas bilix" /LENGTH=243 /DNA_ID=CAMNT_0000853541 /DNA_START=390 /DNA_END=1121 /DNA_ORIENTATION=- /assembly_acc=CAM_ASM_000599